MIELKKDYKISKIFEQKGYIEIKFWLIKKKINIVFKKDLEKDVGGDVSGYFKRFLVSLSVVSVV